MGKREVNRAVFLDRDGVINHAILCDGKAFSPRTREAFRLVEGAASAVRELHGAGFKVLVVTNQPDIARGLLSAADLDWMTGRVLSETHVEELLVCPHDDRDACRLHGGAELGRDYQGRCRDAPRRDRGACSLSRRAAADPLDRQERRCLGRHVAERAAGHRGCRLPAAAGGIAPRSTGPPGQPRGTARIRRRSGVHRRVRILGVADRRVGGQRWVTGNKIPGKAKGGRF